MGVLHKDDDGALTNDGKNIVYGNAVGVGFLIVVIYIIYATAFDGQTNETMVMKSHRPA